MSKIRAWFVTPATSPTTLLEGPYTRYDDCQAKCLTRVDRDTAAKLLMRGVFPAYYVPRLADVPEVLHYIGAQNAQTRAAERHPEIKRSGSSLLPAVIYTYSESALRTLCQALVLPAPRTGYDRAQIIAHIERELHKLSRARVR